MKFTLSIFLALVFTFQLVQSQVIEPSTEKSQKEMYDFYISKHKKLKKTGLILLGAGVVATGVGYAIAHNGSLYDDESTAGAGLALAGVLTTISSIPVLIISGSNKRKANAIEGSGEVGIGAIPFNNTRYASIGIKINF